MYNKTDYHITIPTINKGTFYEIKNLFSEEQLIGCLNSFGYSDENYAILAGDEKWIKLHNPQFFRADENHFIRKDSRTILQHAQDMVASWIFEDLIEYNISLDKEIHICKNGVDSNRIFINPKVKGNSDFLVTYKNKKRLLELSTDYTGLGYRKGYFHLRMHKYDNLLKEKALLLHIDTKHNLFCILNFNKNIKHEKAIVKAWGNKEANQVFIDKNKFHTFSNLTTILKQEINN